MARLLRAGSSRFNPQPPHPPPPPPVPPLLVFRRDDNVNVYYHDLRLIGTTGKYNVPVYKVTKSATDQSPPVGGEEVLIKYSNNVEEACNLKLENYRNTLLPGPVNQHVLNVTQSSAQGPSFCVEHPVPAQSLRVFMLSGHPKGLFESQIVKALCWMLTALNYLHEAGHVHGAISSDHLYVDPDEETGKLAYGASVVDLKTMYGLCGGYVAPGDDPYTRKTDIWYVGLVAVELVYGKLPVKGTKALLKTIQDDKKFPIRASGITKFVKASTYRDDLSPALSQMVARCLHKDPNQRPTARELLQGRPLKAGINTFFDPDEDN